MRHWFNRAVLTRPWATFLVMGAAFLCFGIGSLNIFALLTGTFRLLTDYGLQAAMDGALRQLVELIVSGYVSMGGYLLFKVCEFSLVRYVVEPKEIPSGRVKEGRS